MKLTELNPKLTDSGVLIFDCPTCKEDDQHRIRVAMLPTVDHNGRGWSRTGEYPHSLSLSPSVDIGCWHGHIIDGKIVP